MSANLTPYHVEGEAPDRALVSAFRCKHAILDSNDARPSNFRPLPRTSVSRLEASLNDIPIEVQDVRRKNSSSKDSVLYLAYGSNLCNETFLGKRGIKPLSQINVQVPSLRLTFDLPGIPYLEPCFANSALRDPDDDRPHPLTSCLDQEKARLLRQGYRKDAWHKGLIGVVYEVTPEDYAHIIATEGGGSSYKDILVDCHPFANSDPRVPIPQDPETPSFKAHTLFAPAVPPGEEPPKDGGRFQRSDPSYAQASARYLKLITDGAAERDLPFEYRNYVHSLRPYTITTKKQNLGKTLFSAVWLPIVTAVFGLGKMFADEDGRLPEWLRRLTALIFMAIWTSYDNVFRPMFGDGERTIGDDGEDAGIWRCDRNEHAKPPRDVEKGDDSHDCA